MALRLRHGWKFCLSLVKYRSDFPAASNIRKHKLNKFIGFGYQITCHNLPTCFFFYQRKHGTRSSDKSRILEDDLQIFFVVEQNYISQVSIRKSQNRGTVQQIAQISRKSRENACESVSLVPARPNAFQLATAEAPCNLPQ